MITTALVVQVISDRKHHEKDTLNPLFHRAFEFQAVVPGASRLELDVLDHDTILPDELVGTTTVDLEDRWYDERWRSLGTER